VVAGDDRRAFLRYVLQTDHLRPEHPLDDRPEQYMFEHEVDALAIAFTVLQRDVLRRGG
jgi:hypothetical protein